MFSPLVCESQARKRKRRAEAVGNEDHQTESCKWLPHDVYCGFAGNPCMAS